MPKWRQESEQIRRASGRSRTDSTNQYNVTNSSANSQQFQKSIDDRKKCPHCSRMFSDEASQRHFPICERNAQSSKLMVVRDSSKGKIASGAPKYPKLNRNLSKHSIPSESGQ